MKKVLSVFCLIVIMLSLCTGLYGCGGAGYELALITDGGNVTDRAYNHEAWEGLSAYATVKNMSCKYYVPADKTDGAYMDAVKKAVDGGARVVVFPCAAFETAAYEAQQKYPDVYFILLDGQPHTSDKMTYKTGSNTASVLFSADGSGFVAGYAAVKDGKTKLGFYGSTADASYLDYFSGFLQGAEYAAKELGVDVFMTYLVTNDESKTEMIEQNAKSVLEEADIMFASNGIRKPVISAASAERAKVIAADVDRRYDSETVITSAIKGYDNAVQYILRSIYDTKDFSVRYGGKTVTLGMADDCAGLCTSVINDENGDAFDRFTYFTRSDYENICALIKSKNVTVTENKLKDRPFDAESITSDYGLTNLQITVK